MVYCNYENIRRAEHRGNSTRRNTFVSVSAWFYFFVNGLFESTYIDYMHSTIELMYVPFASFTAYSAIKIVSAVTLTGLLFLLLTCVPLIFLLCFNFVWDKLGLRKVLD